MTTDELNAIVQAVMAELEKAGVDFDFKAETPQADDLVYVMRGTADNYQGITVKWQNLLDIIVKKATDAKDEAVSAKDIALQTLATIQGIESNVSLMKSSVDESEANVSSMKTSVEASEARVTQIKTEAEQTLAEATQTVTGKADKTYVDGELAKKADITYLDGKLANKADKSELAVERARIDSLSKLSEGSTTGDAELIDLRIGADGVTYGNAGDAVRTQISNLKGELGDINKNVFDTNKISDLVLTYGYIKADGSIAGNGTDTNWVHSNYLDVSDTYSIYAELYGAGSIVSIIACYDENKNYVQSSSLIQASFKNEFVIPDGIKYIRITTTVINKDKSFIGKFISDSINDALFATNCKIASLTDEIAYLYEYKESYETVVDVDGMEYTDYLYNGDTYRYYMIENVFNAVTKIDILKISSKANGIYRVAISNTQFHIIYSKEFSISQGVNTLDISDFTPYCDYYLLIGGESNTIGIKNDVTEELLNTRVVAPYNYLSIGDSIKTRIYPDTIALRLSVKLLVRYKVNDYINYLASPLKGKSILLLGDSRSSTDYNFYFSTLTQKTNANVLVQGASGKTASYNASDLYFERVVDNPHDFSIWLVGGNDTGESGTVGTFSANSENGKNGESVVSETDISQDYNGNSFVQAIDHIMRKYKSLFYDFKALNNGHKPIMIFCTDIPQKRESSSQWGMKENWERKRNAILECCEKNGVVCLDLYKLCSFDMSYEISCPNETTDKINDKGLYFMDGLHPNQYGIDLITSLEVSKMLEYNLVNKYPEC